MQTWGMGCLWNMRKQRRRIMYYGALYDKTGVENVARRRVHPRKLRPEVERKREPLLVSIKHHWGLSPDLMKRRKEGHKKREKKICFNPWETKMHEARRMVRKLPLLSSLSPSPPFPSPSSLSFPLPLPDEDHYHQHHRHNHHQFLHL